MTQAVILAGGLGTRLGELTRSLPKPLLPVTGVPFVDVLVGELRRQGIDHILIIAGFFGDLIREHFASDVDITTIVENRAMGTGGALRFAQEYLAPSFFFLNGDSLFDINILDLSFHSGDADAILALRSVPDVSRYGTVELAPDGRITRFAERSPESVAGVINGGVGYLSRRILEAIPEYSAISIEREVYPRLAELGRLNGRVYDRPLIDIGVPEEYSLAQINLPKLLRRGAIIFGHDAILNEDVVHDHQPGPIRWTEDAKAAIKLINDAGLLALLAINRSGAAQGCCGMIDANALHRRMIAELRVVGANIDGIACCPDHALGMVDAYGPVSLMRGSTAGTIDALIERQKVDRSRCALIGRGAMDIEAATAVGIKGVCYENGRLFTAVKQVVNGFKIRADGRAN